MRIWLIALTGSLIFGLAQSVIAKQDSCAQYASYVQAYEAAIHRNGYLPQGEVNNIEQAYVIQKCLVNEAVSKIVGFKAGLQSRATQSRFNAAMPVMGVLQQRHIKQNAKIVANKVSLIEAELAFKLKRDIVDLQDSQRPLEDIIDSIASALEVANINFKSIDAVNVNDIIAANVGASYVRLGKFHDYNLVRLDELKISVQHSSVAPARVYSLPESYQKQLRWLIRKVYLEGYRLEKGVILMPGAISTPAILQSGEYNVDFGALGNQSLVAQ